MNAWFLSRVARSDQKVRQGYECRNEWLDKLGMPELNSSSNTMVADYTLARVLVVSADRTRKSAHVTPRRGCEVMRGARWNECQMRPVPPRPTSGSTKVRSIVLRDTDVAVQSRRSMIRPVFTVIRVRTRTPLGLEDNTNTTFTHTSSIVAIIFRALHQEQRFVLLDQFQFSFQRRGKSTTL
jgi:hypothetical protein